MVRSKGPTRGGRPVSLEPQTRGSQLSIPFPQPAAVSICSLQSPQNSQIPFPSFEDLRGTFALEISFMICLTETGYDRDFLLLSIFLGFYSRGQSEQHLKVEGVWKILSHPLVPPTGIKTLYNNHLLCNRAGISRTHLPFQTLSCNLPGMWLTLNACLNLQLSEMESRKE